MFETETAPAIISAPTRAADAHRNFRVVLVPGEIAPAALKPPEPPPPPDALREDAVRSWCRRSRFHRCSRRKHCWTWLPIAPLPPIATDTALTRIVARANCGRKAEAAIATAAAHTLRANAGGPLPGEFPGGCRYYRVTMTVPPSPPVPPLPPTATERLVPSPMSATRLPAKPPAPPPPPTLSAKIACEPWN